ncbi:MAG: 50S ribosomal protein L24 [Neisseriales bacterium]|nr:MAG: 50S ribosomal protein L24 [Neisseriales bacterium]
MRKIKKNDEVIVICGRDKGRRGVVQKLAGDRLIVEGINRVKKHQKPNPSKGITGGIVEKSMPIHISNIAIFNPITKKADRVGFKLTGSDEKKVRIFKSNGEFIGA